MFFTVHRMCEAESEIYAQNAFPYTTNGCPDGLTMLQNRAYFYGAVPLAMSLHCTLRIYHWQLVAQNISCNM